MSSKKHAGAAAAAHDHGADGGKDGPRLPPDAKAGHNKGLRQFSRQVWMKVMEKRKTTYNEVSSAVAGDGSDTCAGAGTTVHASRLRPQTAGARFAPARDMGTSAPTADGLR